MPRNSFHRRDFARHAQQVDGATWEDIEEEDFKEAESDSVSKVANAVSLIKDKGGKVASHKGFILFLELLLLLWLVASLARKFQFTDNDDARFKDMRNEACSPVNMDTQLITQQHAVQNLRQVDECLRPKGYNKFIWIFVDSMAFDWATELINIFPAAHRNLHKIMNHGFKFSTAIYTSFFTGKIPTNYAGNPIQSDNLFYQMNRSGLRMKFVGPHFPAMALLGDFAKESFVETSELEDEDMILDFLQDKNETYFEGLAKRNESALFTSNFLDDRIHKSGKQDPENRKIISDGVHVLKTVKSFIDSHPEYLLIFNTDHGGSQTGGQHEGTLHGIPDEGNEAWIMFYNPHLFPLVQQESWIDTVDVCATIAQYFHGVNIPMESVGKVLPNTDEIIPKYKILKLNTLQIKNLASLKGFSYDEDMFRAIMSNTGDPLQAISDMEQLINSIKIPLISFKKFPTFELSVVGFLIAFYMISLLKVEYGSVKSLKSAVSSDALTAFISALFLFLDVLYLKFDYFETSERMFALFTICLGGLLLHGMRNISSDSIPLRQLGENSLAQRRNFLWFSVDEQGKLSVQSKVDILLVMWWITRIFGLYLNLWRPPIMYFINIIGIFFLLLLDSTEHKQLKSALSMFKAGVLSPVTYLYSGLLVLCIGYELLQVLLFMQLVYVVMLIHGITALFYNHHTLVYPSSLLLFILSDSQERFYLLTFLFSLYLIIEIAKDVTGTINRKRIILLFINMAYDSYNFMGGSLTMNVAVSAGSVGFVNVEQYPTVAGFLMAYHKFGYFFVLITWFVRLLLLDAQHNTTDERSVFGAELLWKYVKLKAVVLMWTFHLAFWLYKDYLSCFIMAMITSIVAVGFGVILLCYEVSPYILHYSTLLWRQLNTSKSDINMSPIENTEEI